MTQALPFPRFEPPLSGKAPDVLIVAGEHSGDQHAAELVRNLLRDHPDYTVACLGGPELKAAGAQLLFDLTASSVVGLVEVVKHYGFFKALFAETLRWIEEWRPRVICFIDYPGFNLRLAKALYDAKLSRKGGGAIPLAYYISPQIWAWKGKRRFKMAKLLDSLAVIFPFEIDCYKDTDLPVSFVGHPYVDEHYRSPLSYDVEGPILMTPGSRRQAVGRIFPRMLDAFRAFHQQAPESRAIVPYPTETLKVQLQEILDGYSEIKDAVQLIPFAPGMKASAVLASSGTMSLTCALAGIPGAICYVAHPWTYRIGRMLVRISHLGIANLLLPKTPIYREYLQKDASVENLLNELNAAYMPDQVQNTHYIANRLRELLSAPSDRRPEQWLTQFLD